MHERCGDAGRSLVARSLRVSALNEAGRFCDARINQLLTEEGYVLIVERFYLSFDACEQCAARFIPEWRNSQQCRDIWEAFVKANTLELLHDRQ